MIRTDRRRLPVLFTALTVLALAGAMLALLFSTAQAQEGSAPDKPTGLSAVEVSHDEVTIGWDDPGDSSITGYVILRRQHDTHAQGEFTTLVEDTGTAERTYTDAAVNPETRYTYRIRAINEHGESHRSRWLHLDIPAAPTTERDTPAKPRTLTAAEVSHDEVTLTWRDPQERVHHRLRHPAAGQGPPPERHIRDRHGEHRNGGDDVHRRQCEARAAVRVPDQGDQRPGEERDLQLGAGLHPSGSR